MNLEISENQPNITINDEFIKSQIEFLKSKFSFESPPDIGTLEEMGFDIRFLTS